LQGRIHFDAGLDAAAAYHQPGAPSGAEKENGMMRARISMWGGALVASLALATTVTAQVRLTEPVDFAVTGEITAIDTAGKTLTVKGANDDGGSFAVNEKTTIKNGSKSLALGDLKKGWRVVLNGDDDGTRKLVTYMEVVDAP
jgi:hypothetical protein